MSKLTAARMRPAMRGLHGCAKPSRFKGFRKVRRFDPERGYTRWMPA